MTKHFRKILFVIGGIIFSNIFASSDEQSRYGRSEEFDQFRIIMTEIKGIKERVIPTLNLREEVTLLLGTTGSGKTTVLNLLAEEQLNVIDSDDTAELVQIRNNPDARWPIVPGSISGTHFSQVWEEFVDVPGFDDRYEWQNIVNTCALNMIIRKAKSVRVAVILSLRDLSERSEEMKLCMKNLSKIFISCPNEIANSVCLIVTKVPQEHLGVGYKNRIRNILRRVNKETRDDEIRPALNALMEIRDTHLSFFCKPDGIIGNLQSFLSTSRASILESIRHMTESRLVPQVALSDKEEGFLERVFLEIHNSISDTLYSIVGGLRADIDALIIHSLNIADLRGNFSAIGASLQIPLDRENYLSNFKKLLNVFRRISPKKASRLIELEPVLDFLHKSSLLNCIRIDERVWNKFPTEEFTELLRKLTVIPTLERTVDNYLLVRGWLVSVSDFVSELPTNEGLNSDLFTLDVIALHSLFIDENIKSSGLNVGFWSPNLITLGGRKTINLSGKPGESMMERAADNTSGFDGTAGHNGGHFYGKFTHKYGRGFTVNLSGGKGGKGQDGGHGSDGTRGDREDVISFTNLDGRKEIGKKILYPCNVVYGEAYISGGLGRPGCNGGRGGHAGKRGLVEIEGSAVEKVIHISENGKHGKIGIGGRHGGSDMQDSMYSGIYIAEYVLPSFQGIIERDPHVIRAFPRNQDKKMFEYLREAVPLITVPLSINLTNLFLGKYPVVSTIASSVFSISIPSLVSALSGNFWDQQPDRYLFNEHAKNGEIPSDFSEARPSVDINRLYSNGYDAYSSYYADQCEGLNREFIW